MAGTAAPLPTVTAAMLGTTTPAAAAPEIVYPKTALYVGDLDKTVDEKSILDLFIQVSPVVSVKICRDHTQRSLGYAYVNFNNAFDAMNAKDALNFTPLNGKPMRIMFCQRDPSLRKSGYANLFIKNLDHSIDHKALYETFSAFGTVLSCKMAVDDTGKSKGHGFVQFDKEESAHSAIKRLNGMLKNGKKVYVGKFVRRQERNRNEESPRFTNVYVNNLIDNTTDEKLKDMFGKYGSIISAVVMRDGGGKSRCFGFVNFESSVSAAAAVENMNGVSLEGKVLYVGKAEKKAERQAMLKAKFEQERNSRFEKLKGANLYLKNIDESISEDKLKDMFSGFGTITSCKVMRDPKGMSKGAGFVAFSSAEEAAKAMNDMNGKMIGRKPLYAAVAQREDERKTWLQAQFSQLQKPGALTPFQGSLGFHTSAPRLPQQQLYFGPVGPGLVPPAPSYGFQWQSLPGLQTGPSSNFILPSQLQQQPQLCPKLGSRRGGNSHSQQHQLVVDRRNGVSSAVTSQSQAAPVDAGTNFEIPFSAVLSRANLASALASGTPENQRMMLGEQLYPLVEQHERNYAGKVTGMLLEMDQTEVLHLIESPNALKKKVSEAMDVLRSAASNSDINEQLHPLP